MHAAKTRILPALLLASSLGLSGCDVPLGPVLQATERVLEAAAEAPSASPSTAPSAAPSATPSVAAPATGSLGAKEQKLYDMLMAYRAEKGLGPIPLSPSLTKVARLHVQDLNAHDPAQGDCNMHSWSAHGPWTPVCYTADHAQAKGMWDKPRELTDYPGNGYEISMGGSAEVTPEVSLKGWKGSSAHNAVIINEGIWEKANWQAIGVGIDGHYSVVWFGKETDPTTSWEGQ